MSYRDPLANALEDLASRRARMTTLLTEVRAAHRAVMSEEERGMLAHSSRAIDETPSTMEDVTRIVALFEGTERAIERAKAALSIESPASDGVGQWLEHVVAPWSGFAERRGKRSIAHASIDGIDVELEVTIEKLVGGGIRELRFVTESQVPRELVPIAVRPQRALQTIGKALHLASERELGDPAFDDAYWVTGDQVTVFALVTAEVRPWLVALAPHSPTLEISEGSARLTWLSGPIEDVNAAFFEAGDARTATEKLVPRAAFELHRAIRDVLQPSMKVAPPVEPVATYRTAPEGLDAARLANIHAALEGYRDGKASYNQSDWGVPDPSAEFAERLDALDPSDLPYLEEIARTAGGEIASLASGTAATVRAKVVENELTAIRRSGSIGIPELAARFLAEDAGTVVHDFVIELVRDAKDTDYVAELMAVLVANGPAYTRAVQRNYNGFAMQRGVIALVRNGRTDVAEALLSFPTPICIDAAVVLAWNAAKSPAADALVSRIHSMEPELRHEVVSAFARSDIVPVEIIRRFLDDASPDARRIAIDRLITLGKNDDLPAVVRKLDDPEPSVRNTAARVISSVGDSYALRDSRLSALRSAYARDPEVRETAMSSIVKLRIEAKDGVADAGTAFEQALRRLGEAPNDAYDQTLEDVVFFGHDMMSSLGANGEGALLSALHHPRAEELAMHLLHRLSPRAASAALPRALNAATTPEGERFGLWLLERCADAFPFDRKPFDYVVANAPEGRVRDSASRTLARFTNSK